MNYYNRGNILKNLPPVTKNLLIINVVVFAVTELLKLSGSNLANISLYLMLWNFQSPFFKPFQLVTHMFMHGSLGHIFFNMFGVFMFGRVIESVWGGKRFFIFYIVSGLGAALFHLMISYFQINSMLDLANQFINAPTAQDFWQFIKKYDLEQNQNVLLLADHWLNDPGSTAYVAEAKAVIQNIVSLQINRPMVGASGALMGLLAAFAMLFPNVELMIIFLPIPIKAKYFVPIFAVLTLFFGVANFRGDNIAHFAHLGGAIVGFILVKIWNKNRFQQY